jgi:putative membrane protein
MKRPVARPVGVAIREDDGFRAPRAFTPEKAASAGETVETFSDPEVQIEAAAPPKRRSILARIAWTALGILVSAALALAADALIRDLFAANPWLGWVGLAVLAVLVVALIAIAFREYLSLRRLRVLDRLRAFAAATLVSDKRDDGRAVLAELNQIYYSRPDLSRARRTLDENARDLFDGGDMVRLAERTLLAPLDARARALTAASARRVALVTTVSPRALVDIAFVVYESVRLGGAIARLYGARPGLLGTWRLFGAIVSHLAVTGGLVLTDGVVEQLVGQGLAAKLSARLGEGIVNGLMTVRVGIAAMRVTRPLPFETQTSPSVRDFLPELANLTGSRQD